MLHYYFLQNSVERKAEVNVTRVFALGDLGFSIPTCRDRPCSLLSRGGDCVVVCVQYSQCFDLFQNGVERKAEVKVPRILALGDQGLVFLHAETDCAAYCPGEEIV